MGAITWGYARCSTKEQAREGYSLEYQKAKLLKAGVEPSHIVEDVASGGNFNRTGYKSLQSRMREGDTLVVCKLDRLSRNMVDIMLAVDEMTKQGIEFKSIDEPQMDTTSPTGRMFLGIVAVFADFEREQIRDRTRTALETARQHGRHGGRPSKLNEDEIKELIILYESDAYSVKRLCRKYGITPTTLYRYLDETGTPRKAK